MLDAGELMSRRRGSLFYFEAFCMMVVHILKPKKGFLTCYDVIMCDWLCNWS